MARDPIVPCGRSDDWRAVRADGATTGLPSSSGDDDAIDAREYGLLSILGFDGRDDRGRRDVDDEGEAIEHYDRVLRALAGQGIDRAAKAREVLWAEIDVSPVQPVLGMSRNLDRAGIERELVLEAGVGRAGCRRAGPRRGRRSAGGTQRDRGSDLVDRGETSFRVSGSSRRAGGAGGGFDDHDVLGADRPVADHEQ